ncbi:hypothetical protein PBI_IRONMAN_2 [Mycobacterium phage IronMan]|uniref:Metalloprotease n=1 Tax=Mycobacterium phage IronMan TaxID=2499042 RepID=A0A3S9UD70_9CAUD|nr:peptidase [Mycobacterium phage IronMan]AZS08206.1 hypothetical protein PBI_IRONMAN_2 [Mycobacterium phage IronMan]
MGGRGGSGGPGPGTGARNKKGAGAAGGAGSGGVGGGGGSAGSSGSGGKGTGSAGTGGVTGGGGSGGGAGGGSSISNQNATKLKISFGDGLTTAERQTQQDKFDKMPDHLKSKLFDSGMKLYVGTRADKTPGWAEHAKATGAKSTDQIADGREIGSLSFYMGSRNEIFISVHHPGGSVNVYTHEMGHAVDYQIRGDGRLVSNDPDWIKLHNDHIVNNPLINSYYRGGPSGTNNASGRKELFAEGFAIYNERGIIGLRGFVGSREVADMMMAVWKRYGVVQ